MEHISGIIKRVMESITVEDKAAPDPRCLECGKPGDYYYDGVCHECASQPFGILWRLKQPRQPTREEVEKERLQRQWDEAVGELEWAIELAERD